MSLSRTETSHRREPSDEEQHDDPRSFREYVELLASCVRDARAMSAAATRKTRKARLRQDARVSVSRTSNGTSGTPRRNTPRDQTTPFHDSNHATARSASGRRLSSTLGSRSRITPASTSPASNRAATKLRSFSLNTQSLATQRDLPCPGTNRRTAAVRPTPPCWRSALAPTDRATDPGAPTFPDRRRRC
jgi:hypothetical protein